MAADFDAADAKDAERRCKFWMPKKRRYCRLERVQGFDFCGCHCFEHTSDKLQRIPCPLDPGHTIKKGSLKHHLKICQRKHWTDVQESQPYFCKNINTMSDVNSIEGSTDSRFNGSQFDGEKKRTLSERLKSVDVANLVLRVNVAYDRFFSGSSSSVHPHVRHKNTVSGGSTPTDSESYSEKLKCEEGTNVKTTKARKLEVEQIELEEGKSVLVAMESAGGQQRNMRHLVQQFSIIGHMRKRSLLAPGRVLVEFGAGRGKLSSAIKEVHMDFGNRFVLIDRALIRGKADKYLNDAFRARVDIRDLDLSKVAPIASMAETQKVVAYSKHLCGVATDLTLTCLVNTLVRVVGDEGCTGTGEERERRHTDGQADTAANGLDNTREDSKTVENESETNNGGAQENSSLQGVAIATCCQHRCIWSDYVNKEYVRSELKLDEEEFDIIRLMSGWWTGLGKRNRPEEGMDDKHPQEPLETDKRSASKRNIASTVDPSASMKEGSEGLLQDSIGGDEVGSGLTDEQEDPNVQFLMSIDRREMGRKCKRLLDLGRVLYLRSQGLNADLLLYCEEETSLENTLILAWRE